MSTDDQAKQERLERAVQLLEDIHKARTEQLNQIDTKLNRILKLLEPVKREDIVYEIRTSGGGGPGDAGLCNLCQIHDYIGIYCMDNGDHGKCDDVCKYCSQPCHCECHSGSGSAAEDTTTASSEPKFARGGIVKNLTRTFTKRNSCCIPAEGYCPTHDGELITAEQARSPKFQAALQRFNEQVLAERADQHKD